MDLALETRTRTHQSVKEGTEAMARRAIVRVVLSLSHPLTESEDEGRRKGHVTCHCHHFHVVACASEGRGGGEVVTHHWRRHVVACTKGR